MTHVWADHKAARHLHRHSDMAPVLRHYGAASVPDATGSWRPMRCPFHDDDFVSAQTDGLGFRCFACDLFYPAPLVLIRDREVGDFHAAHDLYHRVGGSDRDLPGASEPSLPISGGKRHRATSRRGGTAGFR